MIKDTGLLQRCNSIQKNYLLFFESFQKQGQWLRVKTAHSSYG